MEKKVQIETKDGNGEKYGRRRNRRKERSERKR
jgi:hypothetical protein